MSKERSTSHSEAAVKTYTRRDFLKHCGRAFWFTLGAASMDTVSNRAKYTSKFINWLIDLTEDSSPESSVSNTEEIAGVDYPLSYMSTVSAGPAENQVALPEKRFNPNVILPVENGIRQTRFGEEIEYTTRWGDGSRKFHNALDIEGNENDPIYTPADGTVVHVGPIYNENAQGDSVVIVHYPEYGYYASYGHNKEALVKPGEDVKKGEQIATLGDKGYCTSGYYHVHWEVWENTQYSGDWRNPWIGGGPTDPELFLAALSNKEGIKQYPFPPRMEYIRQWSGSKDVIDVPQEYWEMILEASQKYQVNPYLMVVLADSENGQWEAGKCNGIGACGLFQFIPTTWEHRRENAEDKVEDPRANIFAATKMIKDIGLSDKFNETLNCFRIYDQTGYNRCREAFIANFTGADGGYCWNLDSDHASTVIDTSVALIEMVESTQ